MLSFIAGLKQGPAGHQDDARPVPARLLQPLQQEPRLQAHVHPHCQVSSFVLWRMRISYQKRDTFSAVMTLNFCFWFHIAFYITYLYLNYVFTFNFYQDWGRIWSWLQVCLQDRIQARQVNKNYHRPVLKARQVNKNYHRPVLKARQVNKNHQKPVLKVAMYTRTIRNQFSRSSSSGKQEPPETSSQGRQVNKNHQKPVLKVAR